MSVLLLLVEMMMMQIGLLSRRLSNRMLLLLLLVMMMHLLLLLVVVRPSGLVVVSRQGGGIVRTLPRSCRFSRAHLLLAISTFARLRWWCLRRSLLCRCIWIPRNTNRWRVVRGLTSCTGG